LYYIFQDGFNWGSRALFGEWPGSRGHRWRDRWETNVVFEVVEPSLTSFLGIGLMMAKALEANGAKVYIIGRRAEVLERAAKEAVRRSLKADQPSQN
jgi:hypothetical protein